MKNLKTVMVSLPLCFGTTASATILDAFQPIDHSNDLSFGGAFEGGHSLVGSYRADCAGGERDVELSQLENTSLPGPVFMARFYDYTPAPFRLGGDGNGTPGFSSVGHAILQYDGIGDENGNLGYDRHLNNMGAGTPLFNATDGGVRIWYRQLGSTEGVQTTVTLRRLSAVIASQTVVLGGGGDQVRPANFAFAPEVFGVADSLTIDIFCNLIGPNSDQSLYLDHIDTILPEPSSFAAFGLGGMMLGFWYRRRRNT
ncbi:MAG: PEP-CTERM sorting domain-containing protein [Fimbriimonadales bacterium]